MVVGVGARPPLARRRRARRGGRVRRRGARRDRRRVTGTSDPRSVTTWPTAISARRRASPSGSSRTTCAGSRSARSARYRWSCGASTTRCRPTSVKAALHERLAAVVTHHFEFEHYVDDNMRNIPDHYHAHARPAEPSSGTASSVGISRVDSPVPELHVETLRGAHDRRAHDRSWHAQRGGADEGREHRRRR